MSLSEDCDMAPGMYGWSFAARGVDAWFRLLRSLERHRYLAEVDHRVHWAVDVAGYRAGVAEAEPHVVRMRGLADDLDLGSRDPRLWRSASVDTVVAYLELFWRDASERGRMARRSLVEVLREAEVSSPTHAPFEGNIDEPPHPELMTLDWSLLPVDELDAERHRGALRAMERAGDEVEPSSPVYVEGPMLSEVELDRPLPRGMWPSDPILWASEPYGYADYVFRGVAKHASLGEAPLGYRDIDAL